MTATSARDTAAAEATARDAGAVSATWAGLARPGAAAPAPARPDGPAPGAAPVDAAERGQRRRWWFSIAAGVVGVLLFGSRALTDGDGGGAVALMMVALVGAGVGVWIRRMVTATARRHAAVRAKRPGAEVLEVWGAVGLRGALHAEGVADAPVRRTQGTALTLAVTGAELELWSGRDDARLLHTVRWADVEGVVDGTGTIAGDGPKPAVVVLTHAGNELVLLPARTSTGSIRTASGTEVRRLVGRLEGMRVASSA
ncbi:hypothetical protein AB6N23_03830 [Cellulomonas sp. 179-A 9B4 NHS]|uniref:hypothetical protein n=1 Tax=Cellulomonas sp. 179-A 9B4 NHS TaxID=3142379 RepID=UPI0039A0E575